MQGKVSYTSDLWLNSKLRPFMAVTAHWIARENHSSVLVLKAALIALHHVSGSHSGASLAGEMMMILDCTKVAENVSV